MTISALAVGVVLLLVGGYVQLRMNNSDEGRQQTTAGPTQRPGTTSVVPGRTSSGTTSQQATEPTTQPTTPQETPPAEVLSTAPVRPGDPISLSVPSLGVSARVLAIRARGGSLIPPSNPRLVGWWSDGARPGATTGSAVITGHTVHTGGGAFDDLDRLGAGDKVSVTTRHGTIKYVVTSVAIYRKKTLAKRAQQLFSQGVPGRLVLVTCEDWDGTGYLSNAVVIAVPTT
ncbi:class F sortase [Kribbella sp. VKM Ac-2566]|uniref:class F sortase n=1 Tax=Kribbella sp. VKM Ac-2566 TaxID=2512218 RepID=UPI0010D0F872|nr:class F sortase [Kribbella sp. VKM Ac-2566]TDW81355.1 LPXTG-site transpeptidase (sortase) family protein [Kribbella sp. VKM Ac-2566]